MAGMQFEYDEKGGTFYYFLLSFVALILIPATYYLWPQDDTRKACGYMGSWYCTIIIADIYSFKYIVFMFGGQCKGSDLSIFLFWWWYLHRIRK